ncbi:uncharacterized protein LOC128309694 isoform X1 [Anopheles moucheti]|uniref:uncharacterized protein LOC128309694 isoform X1 n=1 Tax=Anopheles moucheti TaxID=186751 RepID=UPI0022F06A45|nr:uncharacterized protein LOC128309694 isoform X1 [Anopheles moucheti]
MGKGKGGGSGGGGGQSGGGGALQVAVPPKVEMTLKVVLAVAKQETKEERRVVKSDGSFDPFLGQQITPTYFRKR